MRFPVEIRPRSPAPQVSPSPTQIQTLSFTLQPTPTFAPPPTGTPSPDSSKSGPSQGLIGAIIAGAIVIFVIIIIFVLRKFRTKHKNPKYVPTKYLKKLWEKWEPEPMHYRLPDTNDHLEPTRTGNGDGLSRTSTPAPPNFDVTVTPAAEGTGATVGVDRNTSVRSVMTLPAYHPSARDSEQVLGREGERGGIDVVVEFPEGVDEEEERREAEMEALYQVRLARRRENEEREERRRLRREARERGDYVALRELQARARAGSAASGRTVEELRAEHERVKKERQRAVSSVSYADLGVARHDGTRLRANSNDSEREGLLGDAASMAASSRYHRRDRSAGSVISIDTMNSDLPSPTITRSRGNSRASRPESPVRRPSGQSFGGRSSPNPEGRAGSSPEIIDHDDLPPNSPPGYENIPLVTPQDGEAPPDYTSPVAQRGDRRSYLFDVARSTPESSNARRSQVMSTENSGSNSSSPRRGVDGESPQLPSLRLSALPSIHVDSPSPVVHSPGEREEHPRP